MIGRFKMITESISEIPVSGDMDGLRHGVGYVGVTNCHDEKRIYRR